MTTNKQRQVKIEELPAVQQELTLDEADAARGGFNPQPDPPARQGVSQFVSPSLSSIIGVL